MRVGRIEGGCWLAREREREYWVWEGRDAASARERGGVAVVGREGVVVGGLGGGWGKL